MRIITYLKSLEFANPALFWLLLIFPLVSRVVYLEAQKDKLIVYNFHNSTIEFQRILFLGIAYSIYT